MLENSQSILRTQLRAERKLLSKEEVEARSKKIAQNIISDFFPQIPNIENKKIALYLSSNNEVETIYLLEYLTKQLKNHQIALPLIKENNEMDFKKYNPGDNLIRNKHFKNLLEPEYTSPHIDPEIIFTPLVACDKNGNRIGMGGGFYDRKIAELRKNGQNITIIGLSYSFQILNKINPGKFDQTLDFIGSEAGIVKCG